MSDYGLYECLEKQIQQTFPSIKVFGHIFSEEVIPPYILLQLDPFESSSLPQAAGRIKINITLLSRYRGVAEIQELIQKMKLKLEGASFPLLHRAECLIKFDSNQLNLEKDGITRQAFLIFMALIKLNVKEIQK